MTRLTRDGTAKSVSRDQILRHEQGQGTVHFPCSFSLFIFAVQLTLGRIGNITRLIHTLIFLMTIHILQIHNISDQVVLVARSNSYSHVL